MVPHLFPSDEGIANRQANRAGAVEEGKENKPGTVFRQRELLCLGLALPNPFKFPQQFELHGLAGFRIAFLI